MSFEYTETWGARIRQFFRELFGSRLVEQLQEDLMRLRNDRDQQLHDKDQVILSLREEKQLMMSKLAAYELTLMPHASRQGAEYVKTVKPLRPDFSFVDIPAPLTKWEKLQQDHEAQMQKELEAEAAAATKQEVTA